MFLTNFSNSSYRAIPALAQLADELESRMTLLHASEPMGCDGSDAKSRLASFFPEADAYRTLRRVAFRGEVLDALKALSKEQFVDLIVAPSADPLGLPRFMHQPLRSRIIREFRAPVWTMGQAIHSAILNRRTKNVGCWVDLSSKDTAHMSLAVEYASKLNAKLHLLNVLPEIDDSSVGLPLLSGQPLSEEGALMAIRSLFGGTPIRPEIHIASGPGRKLIPGMARDLGLDILFAGEEQSIRRSWLKEGISSAVDRCTCPVICCPASTTEIWRLTKGRAFDANKSPALAA